MGIFPYKEGKIVSLSEAVSLVKDGDIVGVGGNLSAREPMGIIREIIRQGRKMNAGYSELFFAAAALLAVRIGGIHPILVIPAAGIAGLIVYGKEELEPEEAERNDKP